MQFEIFERGQKKKKKIAFLITLRIYYNNRIGISSNSACSWILCQITYYTLYFYLYYTTVIHVIIILCKYLCTNQSVVLSFKLLAFCCLFVPCIILLYFNNYYHIVLVEGWVGGGWPRWAVFSDGWHIPGVMNANVSNTSKIYDPLQYR